MIGFKFEFRLLIQLIWSREAMWGFVWTGWNPTTGRSESTKLRAAEIFHLHNRVRLVIRILRMRNTSIQTFYGQFSKYHELSFAFHYDDDDDVNLKYDGRHLEADTMWKFTKSNAFAGYQWVPPFRFSFWPPLQHISHVFGHFFAALSNSQIWPLSAH